MRFLQTALFKGFWELDKRFQVNGSTMGAMASGRAWQRATVALRHGTWKKMLNFLRIEIQLRLGRTTVSGRPYEWEMDTTNICQLRCPLCHTGLGTVNRQKGVMHFDLFKSTIDQIRDYCIWLSLYSWGEPFLNREIDKYIAYANKANIATIISSNLNKPLTVDMADRLIQSGLDVIIISLDGTTQEVYEVYRVGGRLERVLSNIRLLSERKRVLGSSTPFMEWQFIVMRQNEHQIPEARLLAQEIGVDDIIFKKVDFPHGEDDTALAEKWMPTGSAGYRKENPFEKPFAEGGTRCWRLWRSAVINWDGGYAPCCYLTDAADDFGNVNRHSINEIWNNASYRAARGLFNDGPMPQTPVGCVSCNVYLESTAGKKRGLAIPLHVNGHGAGQPIPSNDLKDPTVTGNGLSANGAATDKISLGKVEARGSAED